MNISPILNGYGAIFVFDSLKGTSKNCTSRFVESLIRYAILKSLGFCHWKVGDLTTFQPYLWHFYASYSQPRGELFWDRVEFTKNCFKHWSF